MSRHYRCLFGVLAVLLLLPCATLFATMKDYSFASGTGTDTDMGKGTTILKAGSSNTSSAVTDIGFKFELDGVVYSQFSANANGVLGLGKSAVTSASDEIFEKASTYPLLAPFWDAGTLVNTGVTYLLTGSPGKYVLTVQWEIRPNGVLTKADMIRYQIRLYETTNRIEFYYASMTMKQVPTTAARIGIAGASNNFFSLYFDKGGNPALDYSASQKVNIANTSISNGTLYTFDPTYCGTVVTGDVAQGGTSGMKNGDILMSAISLQRGVSKAYLPFEIRTATKCSQTTFTFAVTGANASDYVVSPSSISLSPGSGVSPTITFTPGCVGTRTATITVTGTNGFKAAYTLNGTGNSRITWTGNVASGGVSPLGDGAKLLVGQGTPYGTTRTFTPFTIQNTGTVVGAKSAVVTYTLTDPTKQYSLNVAAVSLGNNGINTPIITFKPNGFGVQTAQLTVNADCEVRTFTLNATSTGAGGEFRINGEVINEKSDLFVKTFACSGESVNSFQVTVRSLGNDPLVVNGMQFFQTDSLYGQGMPANPLLRTSQGAPIAMADYFVTDAAGVAPASSNVPMQFPMVLNPGESQTFYLNFVPQRPGKRLARAFIATNAVNFVGKSTANVTTNGLLTVDMFGKGIGAWLAADEEGKPLTTVAFGNTMIGKWRDTTLTIANAGVCDLRISRNAFRIASGDTRDFQIIEGLTGATIDPNEDKYVLAPGESATLSVRFTPSRSGARRATILLQSNDSTLRIPGLIEGGAFYWDLKGTGATGIEARDITIAPAVIDGPAAEMPTGTVMFENTSTEFLTITGITIAGADAAEFAMDPNAPWPAVPFQMMPGEALNLSVVHTPIAGSTPGPRSAQIEATTASGDNIIVAIIGQAVTRQLSAGPATLFDNISVAVGKAVRRSVMITNMGTSPVKLGTTTITGPTATDYTLGRLPRTILAPGQSEYLEVTYRPLNKGTSNAVLTINNNGTGGAVTVQLGGTATQIAPFVEPATGTSGADEPMTLGGAMLWQSTPNPARDVVELHYRTAAAGDVVITLYDANGRQAMTIAQGMRDAGQHVAQFSVSNLANGVYRYSLTTNGQTLTGALSVVK
ncbi:MAG: choice-of-anchor D domain-containing protein [Chlorobi bacterium]|nr:choice-of-anchor D domain-containing protein [Chlorobiota bacterium]MBX7216674.1 choice-of-anchor D domain-containing protein [Candidatus Kapabacteria bacterium]